MCAYSLTRSPWVKAADNSGCKHAKHDHLPDRLPSLANSALTKYHKVEVRSTKTTPIEQALSTDRIFNLL